MARLRVDDAHLGVLEVAAHGVVARFGRVIYAAVRHARRGLRQAVDAGHLHEHLFLHLLHQFHGAERARHDARAQAAHVEHAEHRVVQLGDEHRGHAVEGRATLLVDGGQHHQRVEALHHHLRAAVRQAVHRGQHHAEAVEQGDADAELVFLRELHVLARQEAVVGDVVVGQHDALGEARGAAGVLHVHHVVARHLRLQLFQPRGVHVVAQQEQLVGGVHAAVFLLAHVDHVAHLGEAFAPQVPALAGAQFGQHRVGHLDEVAVLLAVDDAEGVHVRVLAEVFQFCLFVIGVDRHIHGPYLGAGIEQGEPVGHVGGPDAHVRAAGDADGDEPARHVVHAPVELAPREAQVAVGVDDVFFVRGGHGPMFQPLAEGAVGQHRLSVRNRIGCVHFTSFFSSRPAVQSAMLSRVVAAILCMASRVKKAWCEVRMTLGIINRRASLSSSIILSLRSS